MNEILLGKLPPRYSFILNPYSDTRVSRCPKCGKLTYMRKFVLFIFIEKWGPLALGKTCRYCSRCELIVAHRNDLEHVMASIFESVAPDAIGNPYHVVGTVDKKHWKNALEQAPETFKEGLKYLSDFKEHLTLEIRGGWAPAGPPAKPGKK